MTKKAELLKKLNATLRKSDAQDSKGIARLITQVELADERLLKILDRRFSEMKKSEQASEKPSVEPKVK
jgi:hypothetical protein